MSIDVVIPVFNHPDFVVRAVECVEKSNLPTPVNLVIVDDASTEKMDEAYAQISLKKVLRPQIIKLKNGHGFGNAVNVGARVGRAEYILILNSDVFLEPDAIGHLLKSLETKTTGIAGPLLVFDPQSTDANRPPARIQHAGIVFDVLQRSQHLHLNWGPNNPRVQVHKFLQALTGACLLVKRSPFEKVGGFDKVWGMGTYEDLDLCFKFRLAGWVVEFVPEAHGIHLTNASIIGSDRIFPVEENAHIFASRYTKLIVWDEWQH